jgi:iron-sulfur cluster assembly protein
MPISMTEKAASRAKNYLESRGKGMGLKLAVKTTGCSDRKSVV